MHNELISYLEKEGRNWIVAQHDAHWARGHQLDSNTRHAIGAFFQNDTLNRVRICEVPQIENPTFYTEIEKQGVFLPLDFRTMAGITFNDTILIATSKIGEENWSSLVFHECVHVVQYIILGVDRFAYEYVTGWANNGFDYFKIPLEVEAFQLQQRFDINQQIVFSVEKEIAQKWG